jgi:hypothetical protein
VQRQDVRVTQPGEDLYFLEEAFSPSHGRQLGGKDLDGHRPIVAEILREVNRRHSASTDLSFDAVPFREWTLQ